MTALLRSPRTTRCRLRCHVVFSSIYVDCSGETPVTEEYPDLPIVAGNRVECSCVFEARNNESGKVEFLVSCMDQSVYQIACDSINEVNIAVLPLSVPHT